jgi:Cytochrome bd terminal oxidase subunit I
MILEAWTRAFAILFAIGAVSGIIVEFELSLLWPTFMQYSGAIIGLPFVLEGFAFFIEGIFLGVYLYSRMYLTPLVHFEERRSGTAIVGYAPVWRRGILGRSSHNWERSPLAASSC